MLKEYKNRIRPIAVSIIRNNNAIFAYQRQDDVTKEKFYRLVGGAIEFGEKSDIALEREFKEELSLSLSNIRFLSSFDSIFKFNNQKMHEIVYLFDSEFEDKSVYQEDKIQGLEGDRTFEAEWISISDLINKKYTIYPEEILSYL